MPHKSLPTGIKERPITFMEKRIAPRFVIQDGSCWQWIGRQTPYGYGELRVSGKTRKAHRVMWELVGKPVTDDSLVLDHLCNNRLCVNPNHLQEVTVKQNNDRSTTCLTTINSNKEYCYKGHPFSGDNLKIIFKKTKPRRVCIQCRRYTAKIRYYKRVANAKAL
jgi:hypothetical protein